jgi:hypothetical protein
MRRESRDFLRALFIDASTTEDKIPMIAITTSNSMSVKPFESFEVFSFDVNMFTS